MTDRVSQGQSPAPKGLRRGKCLGPVLNLEERVHPEWWRRIFNSLYLKTDGDVVDDPDITQREVDVFEEILKLEHEEKILDLCCGQGRHSLELAKRGFGSVEGIDRSHYLIQRAKASAKREGLNVRFREGDARKLPYAADTFDVVMILGNSFGYFETVEDDLRVLKEVFRVLKPWGRLLVEVADGEYVKSNYQARSWEWINKSHFVCRERSLSLDGQRLISREVISHVDKGVVADQFYAERLYDKASLSELLAKSGFAEVTFHGELAPQSKRDQDMGMMQQCLVITGLVRKEWTPVRKRGKARVTNVAVVLGDPSRPDPLKPASVFDGDDLYTIDQLKSALAEQEHYHFTYLNDHGNLIQDLMKLRGKIDFAFNLADEGFDNDARKELHIPATLEMLGIPYTGAAPQCLAYCYDKSLVRGIAEEMGIPVPEAFFVKPEDSTFKLPFGFPAIVKPNFGDSSFGITQRSVANSVREILSAITEIREKFGYDKPILVEEFLTGKDLSVGVIGNSPESYTVLPIIEEDYSTLPQDLPRICGYEAKWDPESPYWKITSVPAELPEGTEKYVVECCLKLFERLECRDYSRFDWRLDAAGNPKLLEVNPNPGWCWDGHLAKMAKLAAMTYPEMLAAILRATEQRLRIEATNGRREERLIKSPRRTG